MGNRIVNSSERDIHCAYCLFAAVCRGHGHVGRPVSSSLGFGVKGVAVCRFLRLDEIRNPAGVFPHAYHAFAIHPDHIRIADRPGHFFIICIFRRNGFIQPLCRSHRIGFCRVQPVAFQRTHYFKSKFCLIQFHTGHWNYGLVRDFKVDGYKGTGPFLSGFCGHSYRCIIGCLCRDRL